MPSLTYSTIPEKELLAGTPGDDDVLARARGPAETTMSTQEEKTLAAYKKANPERSPGEVEEIYFRARERAVDELGARAPKRGRPSWADKAYREQLEERTAFHANLDLEFKKAQLGSIRTIAGTAALGAGGAAAAPLGMVGGGFARGAGRRISKLGRRITKGTRGLRAKFPTTPPTEPVSTAGKVWKWGMRGTAATGGVALGTLVGEPAYKALTEPEGLAGPEEFAATAEKVFQEAEDKHVTDTTREMEGRNLRDRRIEFYERMLGMQAREAEEDDAFLLEARSRYRDATSKHRFPITDPLDQGTEAGDYAWR